VIGSSADQTSKIVVVVAVIVAQGSVAIRRINTVLGYALCCAAMAALVVVPPLTGLVDLGYPEPVPAILLPSALVFGVLLYSIAVYGQGRVPLLALLVAVLGAVLTSVRLLTSELISSVAPAGWPLPVIVIGALAAVVIAAWSLGRFRRVRADYVIALTERARQAEADRQARVRQAAADERGRIAREMHDVVSHSLAVMVAQAEAGRMAAVKDPARGIAVLPVIAGTGREAMADMRSLLGVLRNRPNDAAESVGEPMPSDAPQPGLADIPALLERMAATGLRVQFDERGTRVELGGMVELTAYRLVQESLTNAIKHGGTSAAVVVDLDWGSTEVIVTITNEGSGWETEHVPGVGQGLLGMRERVTAIGGRLVTGPAGGGYRVSAALPVAGVGLSTAAAANPQGIR